LKNGEEEESLFGQIKDYWFCYRRGEDNIENIFDNWSLE